MTIYRKALSLFNVQLSLVIFINVIHYYFGDRPSPSVHENSRNSSLGYSAFLYVCTVSHGLVSALGSVTVMRSSRIPGAVNRIRSLIVISSLCGDELSMNESGWSATVSTTS